MYARNCARDALWQRRHGVRRLIALYACMYVVIGTILTCAINEILEFGFALVSPSLPGNARKSRLPSQHCPVIFRTIKALMLSSVYTLIGDL